MAGSNAPQSRRDRPTKSALSREGIVATALKLLRDQPLEAVTLRRIATVLDTGPASLFVYIRNTEDLHAALLEALLAQVMEPSSETGPWEDRLISLLTHYTRVLYEYPAIARHTLFTQPSGPHYFAVVERLLALLTEGGVPPRDAAWGVDLLLALVTANAAEHGAKRADEGARAAMSGLFLGITTADAVRFPQVAALAGDLLSGSGPERLEWQLRVLIAGMVAVRRPLTKE